MLGGEETTEQSGGTLEMSFPGIKHKTGESRSQLIEDWTGAGSEA